MVRLPPCCQLAHVRFAHDLCVQTTCPQTPRYFTAFALHAFARRYGAAAAGLCDDGSGGNETGRVLKAWQGKTYQSLPKNSNIDYETAAEWARSVCHRGVRGSLLVLDSREESDFIVGSFPLPILLGARRDAKDGAYKWQGPTYIWEREQVIPAATAGAGFSDWATGQPAADDAKECVAVLAKDGAPQWTTHACEGWPQGENLIAVIEFSPRKVLRAANVVYEVVSDKYEAYGAAFNRIAAASWAGVPGSMLSFTSFDQAAVFTERMNYLAIRKKTPWLGFVRTASKWSYASGPRVGLPLLVDGKPAPLPGLGPPYVDWKVNHPLPSTAANCAISTQGVRRRWASLPCSGPSGISVAMYDMQPRLFYGGSSYMVLPSGYTNYTEALSQAAASYYRGVQGTLLTIESADENKFLRQNVPQLDLAIFAWLGAAYSPGGPGKAPGFAYTAGPLSGTRITEGEVPAPDAFVNFAPFYPRSLEDPDATLVGLAWEPTSGQMQNLEATRNALVVVEHRHRTLLPFRGSYYEILDEEASYDEAVAAARSLSSHGMQGQLLFLQTPEEARFLEGHLAVVGDVWLATVRDDGNTWRWQAGPHSGTPHFPAPPSPPLPGRQTVYNEWATGEPSDAQRMRCAVSRRMATAPGGLPRREWRAQDCMTDAVVVVKYSRRVLVPAVDVVYELLPDDMTYFEATAEVQRRRYNGTKGHLLAIGSQAENKKVHEAFGGGLWLAAQDASSEGTWHWTTDAGHASHLVFWDGFCGGAVPGVYSNFDAGQASSNRDRSLCDATKAGFTPLDGNRTAQHHTDLPGGCCKLCQDDPACSTWEFLDRGSQCHMGPTLVDKRGDRTLFKALSSSYSAAKNVTVDEMFDECAADCCADSRCDQADAFVPTVAVVLGGTKCKAGRPCCVLSKYSNPTSTARRRPQATLFTGIGQRHLAVRVKQDKVQLAADDPNCFLYHGVTRVKRSSLSTLGGLGGVTFDATGGDCLQLQRSGKWADLSCLNRRRVVIEYPQNPSAGPTAAPPTPADPCVTDDDGAAPSTLHVTHGGDDGPGSLRRAITTANSQGGFARITFQAGAGIVRLQTGLPAISSRVIIDGTTHPAYTADGSGPAVIIHWQRASGSQTVHGFHFRGIGASRSLLRGLTVQRFPGHGALVADARHVRIEACLFRDNRLHGLRLSASLPQFTTVGGANDTARCVFIGNFKSGVSVASPRNRIINNFIGVDSAGTAAAQQANRQAGIVLGASATGTEVRGNLVSGNGHEGIRVDGSCGIVVASNAVGVDLAGTSAIANVLGGVAVRSDGCGAGNRNIIGGDDGQGNLISGNTGPGLLLQASGVTVSNNIVGVGADGSTAIPNDGAGIAAENTLEATIGPANVLSGNTGSGLQLTAEVGRVSAVRVLHNSIGVGSDASLQIGNLAHGIRVNGAVEAVVAGNIVAGNGGCGVDVITSESRVAMVQENSIFSNAGGNTYCSPSAEPDLPAATIIEVYDDRLVVEATTSTAGFGESADGAFSVEVFSSPGNVPCDHGVAVARVGALNGTVQPGDTTVLTLEFASVVATGSILTATVTDWTRRTSAFSGCDARMGSGACQLCECTGTAVDCAGRNLAEVPGNIPATTQVLLLGRNQLTEIPATAVQRLQALQTLSAPDNKISDLEFTLTAGLARLVTMDLSSNEVTKIPAGFGAALQRLEELKLRGNKIRSLGMRQLAGMAALRIVDLGNNGWDGIAGGSFAGSLSLQSVDLSGGVAGGSYPGDLFRDLRGLALVNWHRDACPAGFALSFKTGGVYNCLRCGDGTYKPASNGSLTSCVPCPAGTSDADEQPVTPCEGCGAGVYAPRGSAGACTLFQCAPGTTDHDQDPSTACMVCPEGTFTAAGTQTPSCAPCPDGTTDHDRDPSTTCAACTDGQQVPARGIGPCERLLLTVSWGIIGGDGHLPSGVFGVSYPKVPPRQLRQKVSPPGAKIVSYIVSGLPCGMQFDEATGVVHGTPNEQRGEPFEISIRATSDIGVSALVNSGQRIVLAVHDCDDRTTCNGGQCIDTQPFDGRYQCDCSGLETFGPTCRDTGGRPFGVSWALPSRALPVGTLGFPYTFVAPAGAGVTIVGRGTVTQYLATSLPCGITVANQTGSLGGVARDSGTFSVSLLAQSSFQETAQVNDQALALVVRDCDDQLSCNGGACVDDLPFDGSYSCDCAGTDREGSDCTQPSASAAAAAQAATTGAVGGAIGAVLLTLLVLILLWRRRERQRQNQPFDFGQALQRLKESGFIQEEHLLDGAVHPREIKRGSITILETLGAGAFGDVCKGWAVASRVQA